MSAAQVNPKKENVLTSIQKEHFTPPENDGKDSLVALGLDGISAHSTRILPVLVIDTPFVNFHTTSDLNVPSYRLIAANTNPYYAYYQGIYPPPMPYVRPVPDSTRQKRPRQASLPPRVGDTKDKDDQPPVKRRRHGKPNLLALPIEDGVFRILTTEQLRSRYDPGIEIPTEENFSATDLGTATPVTWMPVEYPG